MKFREKLQECGAKPWIHLVKMVFRNHDLGERPPQNHWFIWMVGETLVLPANKFSRSVLLKLGHVSVSPGEL